MDNNRPQILDGSTPYATYELKSPPYGLPHRHYTIPRNPHNPPEPTYTLNSVEIRARAHAHAINHMHRYSHISFMERKIWLAAGIPTEQILTGSKININPIFEGASMFGSLLQPPAEEPIESESDLDSNSDVDSDISVTPERLQPPLFENLPDSVFGELNRVNYRSIDATTAAILTLAKNKIDIINTTDAILKFELTEYEDISHLSRHDADQLLKLLICALSGRVYTIDQFEQASARFLRQVYGTEIMPVFVMLLFMLTQ